MESQPDFCRLSVLVCCCAANQYSKVGCIFQKFEKTVRALRVNETKPTYINAFIVDLFAIESGKKNRLDEITFFWDSPRSFELPLNHLSPDDAFRRFSVVL